MNTDRSSLHLDGIPADKRMKVQKAFRGFTMFGLFVEVSLRPEPKSDLSESR